MPGIGAKAQIAELAQQILFVRVEALHELGVLQFLLALFWGHSAEHAEPASDELLTFRRQILPARSKVVDDFLAFRRRHALEKKFAVAHCLALLRRQLIPTFEIAANLFLPLRRQIAKTRIIAHETLLFFRRMVAQIRYPLWGQTHQGTSVRLTRWLSCPVLSALHLPLLLPLSLTLHARTFATLPQESAARRRGTGKARRKQQHRESRAELDE